MPCHRRFHLDMRVLRVAIATTVEVATGVEATAGEATGAEAVAARATTTRAMQLLQQIVRAPRSKYLARRKASTNLF